MNGERILLDSVILIDHFNGIERATQYLREVSSLAAVSAITRAEVLAGFDEPAFSQAQALMDWMELLPIDKDTADLGARLRRRYRWKLPDALQAAVAHRHGLALATRNTRDFPPQQHDFVRVPYAV